MADQPRHFGVSGVDGAGDVLDSLHDAEPERRNEPVPSAAVVESLSMRNASTKVLGSWASRVLVPITTVQKSSQRRARVVVSTPSV